MLIFVGSRREGNSYNLAKKVKEELDKKRIFCEIITPGNSKIHICTGCMDCDHDGVCDFKDDMEDIINKIRQEEYLMFITPTRWNLLSGDLKIFIDRLNPLYSRNGLKNKRMINVAIASKGKELFSSQEALNNLSSFAEAAGMNLILQYEFNDCLKEDDILKQDEETNKFLSVLEQAISKN